MPDRQAGVPAVASVVGQFVVQVLKLGGYHGLFDGLQVAVAQVLHPQSLLVPVFEAPVLSHGSTDRSTTRFRPLRVMYIGSRSASS